MNESDILLLFFAACAAIYAFGVYISKSALTRWPYFIITAGGGALSGALSSTDVALAFSLAFSALVIFAHGWAVGGRCIDANISKLHSLWAWIPIVYLGLIIPASKVKNYKELSPNNFEQI